MVESSKIEFPFADQAELIKVAHFLSLTIDPSAPKEIVADIVKHAGYPDFDNPDELDVARVSSRMFA